MQPPPSVEGLCVLEGSQLVKSFVAKVLSEFFSCNTFQKFNQSHFQRIFGPGNGYRQSTFLFISGFVKLGVSNRCAILKQAVPGKGIYNSLPLW